MKIQPLLFNTPKNSNNNVKQNTPNSNNSVSGTYNPLYYKDYHLSFTARLFRTPANFYAQPFNQAGMPQTMKDYLNDDYEDRQNIPPAQMMKIVFEPIKIADNLEDVKTMFPDEPLFKNLTTTPNRKARSGVIAEIELMQDENTKLFKETDDTLGLYLLKKIYLEGKSLKEINKDFQNDVTPDFKALSPIDYSTMSAYGIKMPNISFWKSFLATREDFPYEYKPRKAYERAISAQKPEQDLSLADIKNLSPDAKTAPVKRKGKFDDVKDWEIDKLADAMISGKGDEDETRKILKKKNIKHTESSNFVMKYMWAIMPIVLEKTNASAEMKSFWADYDATNKSQKTIMSDYWKQTPQMQALQSLMMKDTIKLFMEAYGVDGNNEEFQQLLQYPAEIAEKRKQFNKEHELKQKEYEEMFATLDAEEKVPEQPIAETTPVQKDVPVENKLIDEIIINPLTGDMIIPDIVTQQFDELLASILDLFPAQTASKYRSFLNKHELATNEYKLVSIWSDVEDLRKIVPEMMSFDDTKKVNTIINRDFTKAYPALFNDTRQAFVDTFASMDISKAEMVYWEDSMGGLIKCANLIPEDMKSSVRKKINERFNFYRQPITNAESYRITNEMLSLLANLKPDDIETKSDYLRTVFSLMKDCMETPALRKDFKDYILRNDLIKKHGGNMRVLLDKNISDKIKKEKVLNLITTDVRFATWASETLLAVAQNDPVTYYKLKSINEHVKEKYSE